MKFSDKTQLLITFEEEVIELFKTHQQLTKKSLEAGGQLFARFSEGELLISKVTGLRSGDKRGRFFFFPNRQKEQEEIKELYAHGYHYVGDWHTHPEAVPTPSKTDLKSIVESYHQSKHKLNFFLMVIVGNEAFPEGLYVSINNTSFCKQLSAVK